jgi:hypothetical protein
VGSADGAAAAQPHGNHAGEPKQFAPDDGGVGDIRLEGHFVADALLDGARLYGAGVDAPSEVVQLAGSRLADDVSERCDRRVGEVADGTDAVLAQRLFGLAAHSPESGDRLRVQKVEGAVERDDEQTVGLGFARGELCHEFGGGSTDAADQPRFIQNPASQDRGDRDRRPDVPSSPRNVEKRLVDAQTFDRWGEFVANGHDHRREVLVAVEVGLEHDRLRASAFGDGEWHGRIDAEFARFVGGGCDYRPGRVVSDDNRPAAQLGTLEQFDRREEGVHVDVQHGSGGIVDVDGADLAPAAVLFAHRSIIPAAGDIRPLR